MLHSASDTDLIAEEAGDDPYSLANVRKTLKRDGDRIDTEELKSVAALAGFDLEDLGLLQLA